LTPVPSAIPKVEGMSAPSVLSPELHQIIVGQGSMPLENPTQLLSYYGYANDGPMLPPANSVQGQDNKVEASKTEPDKNTYLVLEGQKGPDADYNYGTHFLFQCHEAGPNGEDGKPQGYLTRINLDADVAHRVTLMTDQVSDQHSLPFIDGSTWDPFAQRLLLTGEEGDLGGLWQATVDFPSKADNLTGIAGIASYEGVQVDPDGTVWIVEDSGGKVGETAKNAKQPNSFVFRFTPKDKTDLAKGGRLEALQIMDSSGDPITFHEGPIDADIKSKGMKDLHTYGARLKTKWVLIHDTDKDGSEPFNANKLAKSAGATPLKRPENGLFRPGSNFTEFVFAETGDTNAKTEAGAEYGGFGAVLKLTQAKPSASEGEITLDYLGKEAYSGFDNLAFWSADEVMFVEDAGDKLHSQRNALDSGYVVDLTADYSTGGIEPLRFLAEGRDPSATIDSGLGGLKDTGFQNDGDNEITGIHISDGDASLEGLLGAKVPIPFENGWRMFYTQQHGENTTWEVLRKRTDLKNASQ
jgi:Alkaline phosphatase PhoX